MEKFLEGRQIENLVADGLGAVDGVLKPRISLYDPTACVGGITFFVTLAGLPFCKFTQFSAYCSRCQRCHKQRQANSKAVYIL